MSQVELELTKARTQNEIEEAKAESARILEVIKTDADTAAKNLYFLVEAGLIVNKERKAALVEFLKKRRPGEGPSLPSSGPLPADAFGLVQVWEGFSPFVRAVGAGVGVIGFGHLITSDENRTGEIAINGGVIEFRNGISEEEGLQILDADLKSVREEFERLVKVPISEKQLASLVSFAWNVGIKNFSKSTLLELLNKGQYERVPDEMWRWTRRGSTISVGLEKRREAEIRLWETGK